MPEDLLRDIPDLPGGYRLQLWDTQKTDSFGKSMLGYRFMDKEGEALFEGEDFCASPLHAIDSDQTVAALLGFLTLKPGDTDRSYFQGYSQHQLDFLDHVEELVELVYDVEQGYRTFPDIEQAVNGAGEVEVFEMSLEDLLRLPGDSVFHSEDSGEAGPGWYFWSCQPGCLPNGEPYGPYETRAQAYREAFDTFQLWDNGGDDV